MIFFVNVVWYILHPIPCGLQYNTKFIAHSDLKIIAKKRMPGYRVFCYRGPSLAGKLGEVGWSNFWGEVPLRLACLISNATLLMQPFIGFLGQKWYMEHYSIWFGAHWKISWLQFTWNSLRIWGNFPEEIRHSQNVKTRTSLWSD